LSSTSSGPGRWYYGLAALIAVAGIALSISSLISGIGRLDSDLQQVVPEMRSAFVYVNNLIFKQKVNLPNNLRIN
jgi:hypothetical protein